MSSRRIERITSGANARLKSLVALGKARTRLETSSFVIEGVREIARALTGGFAMESVWFCPEVASDEARALWQELTLLDEPSLFELGRDAYAKIAVREDKDGLVVVARSKARRLHELELSAKPLILAVSGIEKPGNLGALLRSADGAGADAVVVLGGGCDLYNPHCVRASLGALFSLNVVEASPDEFFTWCRTRSIPTFAAALVAGAVPPDAVDMSQGAALLLGSEAFGLDAAFITACDRAVVIPMRGVVDSLNVSVAGAILLYEARRQLAHGS